MFCDLILEHGEEPVGNFWPYINLVRPYSMIYYSVSGSGSFTYDGVSYPFTKNNLYIFPANQTISLFNNPEDELKIMFVHAYINPVPNKLIHLDLNEDKFLEHTVKLIRMYVKKPDII